MRSFGLVCPCELGAIPCCGAVVTAADRAAATYAAWGTNPSARLRRAPPLSGEALQETCQKAPSAEGAFWIAHTSLNVSQRWQVAAALSAAVTITKQQGTAPTSQAEPSQKKHPTQTPAALRERGSGGEALLSEKRPLPQNLPRISHFVHNAFSRQARHRAMCSVSHSSASASARCMLNSSAKLRLSRAAASASAVTRPALAATCSR